MLQHKKVLIRSKNEVFLFSRKTNHHFSSILINIKLLLLYPFSWGTYRITSIVPVKIKEFERIYMLQEVRKISDEIGRRMVVASIDEFGIVNLSPEFIIDVTYDSVIFCKFPGTRTLQNIKTNPKGSLAIINWNTMKGFQVKGIMRTISSYTPFTEDSKKKLSEMMKVGATQLVELKAAEIFDVIPKENQLEALWRSDSYQDYFNTKIKYLPFKKPSFEPSSLLQFKDDLNSHLKALLSNRYNSFVGTVETNGSPNVSPRFVLEANDNFLLWGDKFKNKTFMNFSRPSPISVAMIDWIKMNGYQAKGWGTFHFFGETITKVNDYWKPFGIKDPFQAVHFRVEELEYVTLGPSTQIMKAHERAEWASAPTYQPAPVPSVTVPVQQLSKPELPVQKTDTLSPTASLIQKSFFICGGNVETEAKIETIFKNSNYAVTREMILENDDSHFQNLSKSIYVANKNVTIILSSMFNSGKKSDFDLVNDSAKTMKYIRSILSSSLKGMIGRIVILLPEYELNSHTSDVLNLLEDYIKSQISENSPFATAVFVTLPHLEKLSDSVYTALISKSLLPIINAPFLGRINYFIIDSETGIDPIQEVLLNTHLNN